MAQRGEVSCPRSHSLSILGPEMNPWFLDRHSPDLTPFRPLPSTGHFSSCARLGTFKESGFAGLVPPTPGQSPRSLKTGVRGFP